MVFKWFESSTWYRKVLVCIDVFSETGTIKHGVPQGFILGQLFFLLYVNDFCQSFRSWLLFVCRWYLTFLRTWGRYKTEDVLNKEFLSLYQCFIDNRLSPHFEWDKTKSILFSNTRDLREINIYLQVIPLSNTKPT